MKDMVRETSAWGARDLGTCGHGKCLFVLLRAGGGELRTCKSLHRGLRKPRVETRNRFPACDGTVDALFLSHISGSRSWTSAGLALRRNPF